MQMESGAQTPRETKPIGYWLKHLDQLIDNAFDTTLSAQRMSRRHWQVLNLLSRQPAGQAEIRTALAPFLSGDPEAETVVSADLVDRGWVSMDGDGRLRLTETGSGIQAAMLEKVTGVRRLTVDGIGDAEYLAMIDVLQRMAANLESAEIAVR